MALSGTSAATRPPANARNAWLDALRAAAIAEVLFHHAVSIADAPPWLSNLFRAPVGVQVFFVLSGWLIGGQLIRALDRAGRIDLARFWMRRWLRTLPAYYVVLAARVAASPQPRGDTLAMLVFAQNYAAPDAWAVSWSLCVQEHFYLALPLVLLAVARRRRAALAAGAVFLLLSPALRWMAFDSGAALRDDFALLEAPTHMRLDGLVLGVLLAAASERRTAAWRWCCRHAVPLAAAGAGVIALLQCGPWAFDEEHEPVSALAASGGVLALGVAAAMLVPFTVTARPLAATWWRGASRWLADRSYALYLLHTSVFAVVLQAGSRRGLPLAVSLVAMVAATLCGAALLHAFVEKPAMAWRDRLSTRRSRAPAPHPAATPPPA